MTGNVEQIYVAHQVFASRIPCGATLSLFHYFLFIFFPIGCCFCCSLLPTIDAACNLCLFVVWFSVVEYPGESVDLSIYFTVCSIFVLPLHLAKLLQRRLFVGNKTLRSVTDQYHEVMIKIPFVC